MIEWTWPPGGEWVEGRTCDGFFFLDRNTKKAVNPYAWVYDKEKKIVLLTMILLSLQVGVPLKVASSVSLVQIFHAHAPRVPKVFLLVLT